MAKKDDVISEPRDKWRMLAENEAKILDSFTKIREIQHKFHKNAAIVSHLWGFCPKLNNFQHFARMKFWI